jgi:hypothetical protein
LRRYGSASGVGRPAKSHIGGGKIKPPLRIEISSGFTSENE